MPFGRTPAPPSLTTPPPTTLSYSPADVAFFILRCALGLALSAHGWQKCVAPGGAGGWMGPETPVPAALQMLATFAELGGGVAWVIGAFTRLASLGIACDMLTAIALVHLPQHQPFVAPLGQASFEAAANYLAAAVALFIVGPGTLSYEGVGRWAVARWRARRATVAP